LADGFGIYAWIEKRRVGPSSALDGKLHHDSTQKISDGWLSSTGGEVNEQFEFIGDVRRRFFVDVECEWNGVIRDLTAQMEHKEHVNTGLFLVHLAEFYRARAHWANFCDAMRGAQEEK